MAHTAALPQASSSIVKDYNNALVTREILLQMHYFHCFRLLIVCLQSWLYKFILIQLFIIYGNAEFGEVSGVH